MWPSRGVCSLSVRCVLTWTFLITPAHLGLSGALDCSRGVCSLSVRCALTWTCLITPAHLGLSGALGRSRGACSLTGGVCRRWDAPHPKSLRGVVCGPQKPKRLNADEKCQKLFSSLAPSWVVCEPQNPKRLNADQKSVKLWTSAFVGWYASPRIQKDLMQTKKVSNSQLRTPAGRRRCLALRFPPLLPFFFFKRIGLCGLN